MTKSILFAPDPDDEALFASYTIIREKPLVVIVLDSWIQPNRGEKGCDAETRWNETKKAMEILGAPVIRLGIKDFELDYQFFGSFIMKSLSGFDTVYCPAIQEGNPRHDIIARACQAVFGDKCKLYSTYEKGQWFSKSDIEIVPTEEEYELKKKALACYESQLKLPSTKPHFDAAIEAKNEYLFTKQPMI
mgnify:CR=1 FL=1